MVDVKPRLRWHFRADRMAWCVQREDGAWMVAEDVGLGWRATQNELRAFAENRVAA